MKEMRCRAKLPPEPKSIRTRAASSARRSGFRRCGKPRCPMCPFTGEASGGVRVIKEVVVNSSNTTLTLQHSMTCQTTNCIYLLTCCKDGLQYVGETGRRIAKRFSEHRDSIHQENTTKPVGQHYQLPGHRLEADAVMTPIIRLKTNNIWVRKAM